MPKRDGSFDESDHAIKDRTRKCCNCDFGPHHVDVHPPDFRRNAESHADHWRSEELGEVRNPRPTTGVPKNSATMAPISASVELIFSALKMNGIAAGSLSFSKVGQ